MYDLGIYTGADLRKLERSRFSQIFWEIWRSLFQNCKSIQNNPVNPYRIRKSIGAEQTFSKDLTSESFILEKLAYISEDLENRMRKNSNKGKTITIKIKYNDFSQETRSKTVDKYISRKEEFFPIIENLIFNKSMKKPVRLLGIAITNLYKKIV